MPSDTLKWFQGYNVKTRIYLVKHLFFFVCSMTNCIIGLRRTLVHSFYQLRPNNGK